MGANQLGYCTNLSKRPRKRAVVKRKGMVKTVHIGEKAYKGKSLKDLVTVLKEE